jgi:UDP-3-O-[3-hydroxymyristoyl] glucosamine N-acyltransferase
MTKSLTPQKIAEFAGLPPAEVEAIAKDRSLAKVRITRVSGLEDAAPESLVFCLDEASFTAAVGGTAGLILAASAMRPYVAELPAARDPRVLWIDAPKYTFSLCGRELSTSIEIGIHQQSFVDSTVRYGKRLCVDAFAVIEEGVTLGDDVTIRAGAKILKGTQIGSRVTVQANAVLGSAGFGYVRSRATGEYILFPQQGKLVIEDDVEIGANTTIDRGALGETRIGQGTKIDNLVQIGHNCKIGKNVVIASQVGISGSCVIEDGAILAGQVGLGDHVTIGKGVILGGQGGVYPGKTVTGEGEMFAGTPAEPVRDFLKTLAKLRRLK